jgi:AcrR family transcriptional regulator
VVGRPPDPERREELLDGIVAHLAAHGLADVSLRPLARDLGVSVNALVHHFGTKDELVVTALRRAEEVQQQLGDRWLARDPDMSQADYMRKWWRWMNRRPENLALVRLGIEAAAMDATISGLPGEVRAEQINRWREGIEARLVARGMARDRAAAEASLAKAMFTGVVVDLLATGERRRLTATLELGLRRLTDLS